MLQLGGGGGGRVIQLSLQNITRSVCVCVGGGGGGIVRNTQKQHDLINLWTAP